MNNTSKTAVSVFLREFGLKEIDYDELLSAICEKELPETILMCLIDLVRRTDYDISNLYQELSELQSEILSQAIESGQVRKAVKASNLLGSLFQECLDQTARGQELAIENTSHAYAEISKDGEILDFNTALVNLLNDESVKGQYLTDWFPHNSNRLTEAIDLLDDEENTTIRLSNLCRKAIKNYPAAFVSMEIFTIPHEGNLRYMVFLTDVSESVFAEQRVFDSAKFGIIRVDRELNISYVNKVAASYIGTTIKQIIGCSILNIVSDKDVGILQEQLERRRKGDSGKYIISAKGPDGGSRRIEVIALPEFEEGGEVQVGTLAFLRLVEPFYLRDQIREIIERKQKAHIMVTEASGVIDTLVPHDQLIFTIYDHTGKWAWPAHIQPKPDQPWATRWFQLSPHVRNWMRQETNEFNHILIKDFKCWYEDLPENDPLRNDPVMLDFLEQGIKSTLTIPVYKEKKLWASVSLLRRENKLGFDDADSEHLDDMQMSHFVLSIRNAFDLREQSKLEELKEEVLTTISGVSNSNEKIGQAEKFKNYNLKPISAGQSIVKSLSRLYRWPSVSLFHIDNQESVFRLFASYNNKEGFMNHLIGKEISIDNGLMGLALRKGKGQIVSQTGEKTESGELFNPYFEGTQSGLALPIKFIDRPVWMLDCEDSASNGFTNLDISKLEDFGEYIQVILERVYTESLFTEVFDKSAEMILFVDLEYKILQANRYTLELLDLERKNLIGKNFKELFENVLDFKVLESRREGELNNFRTTLKKKDGRPCYVLLHSKELASSFGQRVIYATPVVETDWKIDSRAIEGALSRLARDSGRSIQMVRSMLTDVKEHITDSDEEREWNRKINSFVDGVDLTFKKIADNIKYEKDRYPKTVDVSALIHNTAEKIEEKNNSQDDILIKQIGSNMTVNGFEHELEVAFLAIQDYLLRNKSDNSLLKVKLDKIRRVSGVYVRARLSAQTEDYLIKSENPYDIAFKVGSELIDLGEPALRRTIEQRHFGSYLRKYSTETCTQAFEVCLPIFHRK